MRTLIRVIVPVEAGNKAIKEGTLPQVISRFMETHRPEATYFLPENGERSMLAVFDLKDPSQIPEISQPFFESLHASVSFSPIMNADELKAGLAKIRKT